MSMKLVFEEIFDAREHLRPASGDWERWFDALDRRPQYAAIWSGPSVHGHEGAPVRLGGYFREPTESVVGLRAFDDALEGTLRLEGIEEPVPYVFFEIEKVVRMLLHSSTLAFEILASPARLLPDEHAEDAAAARDLVAWSIAEGLLGGYRESVDGGVDDLRQGREVSVGGALRLLRRLATGAALADGRATLDVRRLSESPEGDLVEEFLASDPVEPLGSRRARLLELAERLVASIEREEGALPSDPEEYEALNAWLIEQRLSESSSGPTG